VVKELIRDSYFISELPYKIIYKDAKEIGIGYAIKKYITVVVALYSINDNMSINDTLSTKGTMSTKDTMDINDTMSIKDTMNIVK